MNKCRNLPEDGGLPADPEFPLIHWCSPKLILNSIVDIIGSWSDNGYEQCSKVVFGYLKI